MCENTKFSDAAAPQLSRLLTRSEGASGEMPKTKLQASGASNRETLQSQTDLTRKINSRSAPYIFFTDDYEYRGLASAAPC